MELELADPAGEVGTTGVDPVSRLRTGLVWDHLTHFWKLLSLCIMGALADATKRFQNDHEVDGQSHSLLHPQVSLERRSI